MKKLLDNISLNAHNQLMNSEYISLNIFFKENVAQWDEDQVTYAADSLCQLKPLPLSSGTARKLLQDPDSYRDFVYWKRFDLIFFNVTHETSHKMFMGNLFDIEISLNENITISEACKKNESKFSEDVLYEDMADQWVYDNYGFFLSSVAKNITMSEDYKFTEQHKRLFKGLGICRIER